MRNFVYLQTIKFLFSIKLNMNTIKVLDKEFELYIKQEEIEAVIKDIANQISEEYKDKDPLFLVMLNGAFMFASQLFKELTID